jgi:type IV pilus assembly protein PilY1
MNAANKADLANLIDNLDTNSDRGSNAQYAMAMNEAYLYFGGKTARSGSGQVKRDTGTPFVTPPGTSTNYGDNGAFVGGAGGTQYKSPAGNGCQKNFIILISNGTTDNGENNPAEALLTTLGGKLGTDPIPLNPSGEQANWGDEFARFMANNDIVPDALLPDTQTAITYTIAVYDNADCPNLSDPTPPNTAACRQVALAKSMAHQGDGKFFAGTDLSSIVDALNEFFAEVQDVNSVFASVTLPVSVNQRGTNLNQVYMGLFRPDPNLSPRWLGNLKMYKLAVDSNGNLFLADSLDAPAVSGSTGFISSSAVSHWTTSSTFWAFDPQGNGGASDNPDGDLVEKGAVAQGLRTTYATDQSTRKLYTCIGTCTGGSSLSSTAFNDANTGITDVALGVTGNAAERTAIINWMRGQDNLDNENANVDGSGNPVLTDARASVHGDVLHSRPAVINYNRFGDDNDLYVFYGANDGIFRAVKGAFGTGAGAEQWGFIPSEFFGKLKRLRDNTPAISLANKRPYFADGPIGTYISDTGNNPADVLSDSKLVATDGDKVYLYIGMRRGGRFIYALDVSDPADPKLLWKKSSSDTGFGELGYTFSEPKVAKINGNANPVIIMAAGYDPNQDTDPVPAAGTDTMGRGIMILDAFTGALLWQAGPSPTGAAQNLTVAGMIHSIPSDVTILDRNGNGFIDRVYVGDTGGNLWRVDIDDASSANWAVNKLAAVGDVAGTDPTARRKFMFPPDVVFNPGANPGFDSVLLGSGDREHPFDVTVVNRYYMFKDPDTGQLSAGGAAIAESDMLDVTTNLIQVGTAAEQDSATAALLAGKGWYLTLGTGEKVIGSSVTLAGTTFFNTNQPNSAASPTCGSNLGIAREYAVSYIDARSTIDSGTAGLDTSDRFIVNPAGGYLPSPVPGVSSIDGKNELFVLSGASLRRPPSSPLEARYRTYWYMNTD